MPPRPHLWIIDAHVQIFRAYHSLPPLEGPAGQPLGAVRGFAATLIRFLDRQQPGHVALAWDHAFTSFRNEIFADYKQGRTEAPEDLAPQIEPCRQVAEALGLAVFSAEGFEADDVVATLVPRALAAGADVVIVSPDKDLAALVGPRVSLFDLRKEERTDASGVEARLGVPPARVSDLLSLMGDAVDHIPGVPGIGARTAAALLSHFGSLDQIPSGFDAWDDLVLRGKRRAFDALAKHADLLALSRSLVTMRDDVPLDFDLDGLAWRGAERQPVQAVFGDLGLDSLAERIPRFR